MKKLVFLLFTFGFFLNGQTQTGLTQTILINVNANPNGTVTLTWPKASFSGKYNIYKNTTGIPLSFSILKASPLSTDSSWTDSEFTSGSRAEYLVTKVNTGGQTIAVGFIEAGNKTAEIATHGPVILLIDSNYIKPLAAEISVLINDLETNGYPVYLQYAGRNEKPATIKNRLKNIWENSKPTPKYLYLLGHIPVPYSGNFSGDNDRCAYPPDGHVEGAGNHTGAWPADVFYAEFEGFWTDNSVTKTTGSQTRHHNIPGDGKYDQCNIPSTVVLKMGRVDLYGMPSFAKSDTALVKDYLNRVHQWKINATPFVRRGLVDDNFTGLDLSATGYLTLMASINRDSIFQRDYFTSQNAENYLWSYGCGAGSYTNCSGVGSTANFAAGNFKNIFTSLAGSYFGDWDVSNNFLRAPLCAGSLLSFWGGIPRWYNHFFGLGMPMGFCAMTTQNSTSFSFNGSENKVHIALMGDPTLTLFTVPPAGKLTAVSTGGKVNLNWTAATGNFDGYVVYRIDTVNNVWTRLNPTILTTTSFSDANNFVSGKHKYAVRTIRLDNSGSGSYYNLGGGSVAWVNHTAGAVMDISGLSFTASPNPGNGLFNLTTNYAIPGNVEVLVTDVSGRNTTVRAHTGMSKNQFELDLSAFAPGIYFINIISEIGTGSVKVQICR